MNLTIHSLYKQASVDSSKGDRKSYDLLKKSIQLQIKANGGVGLTIDGVFYTKEEINNYLDYYETEFPFHDDVLTEEIVESSQDDEEPYINLEWHLPLKDPTKLTQLFEVPSDLMDQNKRIEAQMLVDRLYSDGILRGIQVLFSELDFKGILLLQSYEYVFSQQLIFKYKSALLTMFNNFYNREKLKFQSGETSQGSIENSYYFNYQFYFIGTILYEIDKLVASKFIDLAKDFCSVNKLSVHDKKRVFELLIKMPHDPEDARWIRRNINHFNEQLGKENAKEEDGFVNSVNAETETKTSNTTRVEFDPNKYRNTIRVFVWIGLLVAVVYLISKYMVGDDESNKSTKEEDKLMQSIEAHLSGELSEDEKKEINGTDYFAVGMFYEKDDVIKEYESTISQIKKNTNNKTVSKYLENTLSMFCYDMLADSTAGFTYEDGSLPKIGMQQAEIQSESDYKTALFIAYDITKPNSTLRGILYKPNSEGKKFYISKNDLIFVIINPVIKNGKVLYADIQDRNQLNICFEAHKLIKEKNSKTIYLTYSAPKKYPNLESLTHIYETMCFYRLNKPYRFDKI